MLKLNQLTKLNNNYKNGNGFAEILADNPDYSDLYPISKHNNLIVYSYIHNILEITNELILNNIEFSHHNCPYSSETYLLINNNQIEF
jgi:hypothetical protein